MLIRPSSRVLIELHLAGSFPWYLTADPTTTHHLGAAPMRVSTEDLYPGGALGSVLFERRLIANQVELKTALVNELNGMQRIESFQFEIDNSDGSLNLFFTREMRGKKVVVHLYDKNTGTITQNVFVGEISAFTFGLHKASVLATSFDVALLKETVPKAKVTLDVFPKAQEGGSFIPYGMGIGQRIPGRYVKARGAGDPDHYDYVFMSGNCGFVQVWRGDLVIGNTSDFERLHRTYLKNGRYCTALRLRLANINSSGNLQSLTATVQRTYPDVDSQVLGEWKWDLGPESDVVSNMTATYHGNMGDSDRCAGPTGYGMQAVNFEGVDPDDDYTTLPGNFFALQDATFEFDVNIGAEEEALDYGLVITGSRTHPSFSSDFSRGWWVYLEKNVAGPRLNLEVKLVDSQDPGSYNLFTTYCSVSYSAWHRITVRIKKGIYKIVADEDLTNEGTITQSGMEIMYAELGYELSDVYLGNHPEWGDPFVGKIGWVRISGLTRSDGYVKTSSRLMHRNVMQLIRETVEQVGTVPINESTGDYCWDNAVADIDNVESGALHCDGYVTEETEVQEVLKALCLFRDIRLWRGSGGMLEAGVSKAVAATSATFGIGDQYNNIIGDVSRTKLSTAEAVRVLPIEYRPRRGASGSLEGYHLRIEGDVLPVGTVADALQLPFVWDKTTADIIRSFRCKRMKTRDEQLSITVGHEGRLLAPGYKVAINLPAHEISNGAYQVAAVANRITEFGLDLVPYAASDYVYEAQTLPADEEIDLSLALDIGTTPDLICVPGNGDGEDASTSDTISIAVRLKSPNYLYAAGDVTPLLYSSTEATLHAAIDDEWDTPDDDSTYIYATLLHGQNAHQLFLAGQVDAGNFSELYNLRIKLRWKVSGINPQNVFAYWWLEIGGIEVQATAFDWVVSSNAYPSPDQIWELNLNPIGNTQWSFEDFVNLKFGFGIANYSGYTQTVTVTQCALDAQLRADAPSDWSVTKIWKRLDDESPVPQDPQLYDSTFFVGKQMSNIRDGPLDASGSGKKYYYWARVYDAAGRASELIGPGYVAVV